MGITEKLQSGEPPKHKWRNMVIIMFWITVISFLIAAIHGCNTAKHIDKKIHKFNQRDAAQVRKTLAELYPPDTVIKYKNGLPIITKVKVIDSSGYKDFRHKNDSLTNIIKQKDTALYNNPLFQRYRDSVNAAAAKSCVIWDETDTVKIVDTLTIIPDKVKVQLALIPDLQKDGIKKDQQIVDLKSDRNRWLFSSIGEWVLILLLTYLLIKSFLKQKVKTIA